LKIILEDVPREGQDIVTDASFAFEGGSFSSVKFSGRLIPVGEDKTEFYLSGKINASALLPCGRCLEDVTTELKGELGLRVLTSEGSSLPDELELEDDDVSSYTAENGELDLGWLIEQEALLLLPMKVTCDKACGSELIEDEDAEIKPEADPRWEALNKLKNN
jgi:uncharacterized metal-binding protein YceD (DUF177 family)